MTIAEMQAHLIEAIAGEAKTRPLIEGFMQRLKVKPEQGQT